MAVIDIPTARFVQKRECFPFKGTPPAKFASESAPVDPEWQRIRQFLEVPPPETVDVSIIDVSGLTIRAVSAIWLGSHCRLHGLGVSRTFEVAAELQQYWQNGRLYCVADNWPGVKPNRQPNFREYKYLHLKRGDEIGGKRRPALSFETFGPDHLSVTQHELPPKSYVAVIGDASFLRS